MIILRKKNVMWLLFVLLPIMDSLNGFLNNGGNIDNGLSIGIIYRLVFFAFCVWIFIGHKISKKRFQWMFFIIVYMLIITVLRIPYDNIAMQVFRIILPIISIEAMVVLYKDKVIDLDFAETIVEAWLYLFPLSLIVPLVLGFGFETYGKGQAGYKGFYYAQNDIGYILICCYFLALTYMISSPSIKHLGKLLLVLFCNMILGLKSNYIMVVVSLGVVLITRGSKMAKIWKYLILGIITAGVIVILNSYSEVLLKVVARWKYFWSVNENGLLSFLSSTRTDRIIPSYLYIKEEFGISGLVFGSGYAYTMANNGMIIEMDFFDILFLIGIVGLICIYMYYVKIFFSNKQNILQNKYKVCFVLSMLVSFFSGHVLTTALSGMFFVIVCVGIIMSAKKRELSEIEMEYNSTLKNVIYKKK